MCNIDLKNVKLKKDSLYLNLLSFQYLFIFHFINNAVSCSPRFFYWFLIKM